jgi:hypothetical protein
VNSLDPFPNARGAAVNTFTTLRDVCGGSLPVSYGNELRVGSKVQCEAFGEYSTTGTPTMRLGFGYGVTSGGAATVGTNVLAVSELVAVPATTAAAWSWHLNWMGIVTAVGSTGTIYGHGFLDLSSSLIAAATKPFPITAALRSVTIDTTLTKTWDVIAEFGTSSASNQVIVDYFNVKIENQSKTS